MKVNLLCLCLSWSLVAADSPAQINPRASTNQVASKVIGSNGRSDSFAISAPSGSAQEALRVRESYLRQLEEPERWAEYVPETAGTVASELSEARREAREMEKRKAQEQRAELQMKQQQQSRASNDNVEVKGIKRSRDASGKKRSSSTLKRAVQKLKASTKKAERRAIARLEHFLDLDDDDDDGDDHHNSLDLDDEEDHHSDDFMMDAGSAGSKKRHPKRSKPSFFSRIWIMTKSIIVLFYVASKWSSWNLFWVPTTYVGEAVRWSASTSWKTTRWTGERALVGPALTAGAPVLYLAEGLLFLFVWTPARVIGILVRELYPVYIYLGAALAVGTAMGIASAIILYIGSFFLSDTSLVEDQVSRRADQIPEDLSRRYKQRRKSSSGPKWTRKGESVIERAIRESLQREKRKGPIIAGQKHQDNPESDEDDDDYFGQGLPAMSKGNTRANGNNYDATVSGSSRRTPPHFGPPSVPVGATGQGGWSSSSSSPAMSPVTVRSNIPSSSSFSYTSARSKAPTLSPLTSPDVVRSVSSRQRRNVSTAS